MFRHFDFSLTMIDLGFGCLRRTRCLPSSKRAPVASGLSRAGPFSASNHSVQHAVKSDHAPPQNVLPGILAVTALNRFRGSISTFLSSKLVKIASGTLAAQSARQA